MHFGSVHLGRIYLQRRFKTEPDEIKEQRTSQYTDKRTGSTSERGIWKPPNKKPNDKCNFKNGE